jgi:uncharacterized protein
VNREVKHALVSFAVVLVAIVCLAQLGRAIGFVGDNLGAFVAVVFLYVPVAAARIRGEDLADYGFTWKPVGRGVGIGLGVPLVVFPLFAVGFVLFYDVVCAADAGSPLAKIAFPGMCSTWRGWEGARFPALGLSFLELAAIQVIVIALPEELFFRGYVHRLLEQAIPPRRRLLGGGVGWALVLSSAIFAIGHLAVAPDPRRLAVFFPGLLFGWMRSATGSILAGTIAHAVSNLFILILERVFFF